MRYSTTSGERRSIDVIVFVAKEQQARTGEQEEAASAASQ